MGGGSPTDATARAIDIATLRARLERSVPIAMPDLFAPRRAAVAVVLRERAGDTEVLLIRRAEREGDRWSGQMAFPGGRHDPDDRDLEATARREAMEEVGLDLAMFAHVIGRLSDQQAVARGKPLASWTRSLVALRQSLPLSITPIVFALHQDPGALVASPSEVDSIHWVPLGALLSGRHDSRHTYWLWRVMPMRFACWRYDDQVIWGLTYRMLSRLLAMRQALSL